MQFYSFMITQVMNHNLKETNTKNSQYVLWPKQELQQLIISSFLKSGPKLPWRDHWCFPRIGRLVLRTCQVWMISFLDMIFNVVCLFILGLVLISGLSSWKKNFECTTDWIALRLFNKFRQACFGSVFLTNPIVPVHIKVRKVWSGEVLKEWIKF